MHFPAALSAIALFFGAMSAPPIIFDTILARRRLRRAANGGETFLLDHVVEDMLDRVRSVQRTFRHVADIGTPTRALARGLEATYPDALTIRLAPQDADVGADLEAIPLAPACLDLATSALALQSINDLPGTLLQIRTTLRPDGLFLGALLGGRTLSELRTILTDAETDLGGGTRPGVAPFPDGRDMGGLLQRAGFALPVADSELVTVRYPSMFALMADLRAMGATNVLVARSRRPTSRALFLDAARRYASRFADPDGRVRASFEILSLSGWAPHASQAKPARRGSATISLAAALDAARDPSI